MISCPKFIYRFPFAFEDRKARFDEEFSGQFCDQVQLNNFNLRTYNDKSEVDYLIYEEIPASSTSRQISPVDSIYCPKLN